MGNILNSDFVQWMVRFAFSKSGVAIRWIIGYFMGWLAAKNIVPSGDVAQISVSLTSGLTALVAILYAGLQYWLNKRQSNAIKVVQTLAGHPADGIVGNGTIQAVAKATGQNPNEAIAIVTNTSPIV